MLLMTARGRGESTARSSHANALLRVASRVRLNDRYHFCNLPNRRWSVLLLTSSVFWRDKEEKAQREASAPHVQSHHAELQCFGVFSHVFPKLRVQTLYAQW